MRKPETNSAFGLLFLLALAICIVMFGFTHNSEYSKEVKINLDKYVVIQQDTLRIINFNLINNSYTLENGTKIKIKHYNKLKLKDDAKEN